MPFEQVRLVYHMYLQNLSEYRIQDYRDNNFVDKSAVHTH